MHPHTSRTLLRIYDACLHFLRLLFLLLKDGRRAPESCPSALIMPTSHLHTSHLPPCPTLLRIDDACLHSASSSFIKKGAARPAARPRKLPVCPKYAPLRRIFTRRIFLPARPYCRSTMPASTPLRLLSKIHLQADSPTPPWSPMLLRFFSDHFLVARKRPFAS